MRTSFKIYGALLCAASTVLAAPGTAKACTPNIQWYGNSLTTVTGTTSAPLDPPPGVLTAYLDGSDQHVDYLDANGHVWELYNPGGYWVTPSDLTATAHAPAAGGELSGYAGTDGSQHINYEALSTTNNVCHIEELYWRSGINWTNNDLTSVAQPGYGGAVVPPACMAGGSLGIASYWDWGGAQHVFFVGSDGHVHELYDPYSGGQWQDNDLTAWANTSSWPNYVGLDAYWGSDHTQHVNYVDLVTEHVHELYNGPAGGWVDNDLTNMAQPGLATSVVTQPAYLSRLSGFWGSDGSQHVLFVDGSWNVHELYDPYSGGQWKDNNLSGAAGSRTVASVTAFAGFRTSDSSEYVGYIDNQNYFNVLSVHAGGSWGKLVLTPALPANYGVPMIGYVDLSNDLHLDAFSGAGTASPPSYTLHEAYGVVGACQ